jgi:hypothetical protein
VECTVNGIDESSGILIFVTQAYMDKVNCSIESCKLEFKYAVEKEVKRPGTWKSFFSALFGYPLDVNLAPESQGQAPDNLLRQVTKILTKFGGGT